MEFVLITSYYSAFVFYLMAIGLKLTGYKKAGGLAGLMGFLINGGLVLMLTAMSGHAPVFEVFESLMLGSFVLSGLGLFLSAPEERLPDTRLWVWLMVLILFGYTLFLPKTPSPSVYDHNYPFIILFHGSRMAVLGLMLFSSAFFIQYRVERKRGVSGRDTLHKGRNFLLLSAIVFLVAEYSGIIWALNGWGDFWHWSYGFFQSTFVILYLMLAFHIPGKNNRSEEIRALIGGMGGFIMLTLHISRHIL